MKLFQRIKNFQSTQNQTNSYDFLQWKYIKRNLWLNCNIIYLLVLLSFLISSLFSQRNGCRVRHEVPNLRTENMILCCLVMAITHLRGGYRWMWRNGEMMISSGNKQKAEKNLLSHITEPTRSYTKLNPVLRRSESSA